ncbi:YraN family protein [bacterium]|nr:MAG: YraN family protein [bacterium]
MSLGSEGEALVAEHAARLGWRVLERNWRCRYGELDLVAEDGGTVVFVEVKTRSSRRRGAPEEAVDARKQARLARLAAAYLSERGWLERPCRFDVAAVEGGEVRLLRAAFSVEGAA